MSMNPAILVVDDEVELVNLVKRYFQMRHGWHIVFEVDAFQALKAVEEEVFDLAVVDIMMPGVSGTDVIKKIRELSPSTTVFAHTVMDDPVVTNQIEALGAILLVKPNSLKALENILMNELKKKGFDLGL